MGLFAELVQEKRPDAETGGLFKELVAGPEAGAEEMRPLYSDLSPDEAAQEAKEIHDYSVQNRVPFTEVAEAHASAKSISDIVFDPGLLLSPDDPDYPADAPRPTAGIDWAAVVGGTKQGGQLALRGAKQLWNKTAAEPMSYLMSHNSFGSMAATMEMLKDMDAGVGPFADAEAPLDINAVMEYGTEKTKQVHREMLKNTRLDVEEAKVWSEKAVDIGAGIAAFMARLWVIKKAFGLPGTTGGSALAWELESQATGGKPGAGAAKRLALGGIGKIPTKQLGGKVLKVASESAVMAGAAAAEGAGPEDIIVSAAIPVAFNAWGFYRQYRFVEKTESKWRGDVVGRFYKRVAQGGSRRGARTLAESEMRQVDKAVAELKTVIYRDAFAGTPGEEKHETLRKQALGRLKSRDPRQRQIGQDQLRILEAQKPTPSAIPKKGIQVETSMQQVTETAKQIVRNITRPEAKVPASAAEMRRALRRWEETAGAAEEARLDAEDAALAEEYADILRTEAPRRPVREAAQEGRAQTEALQAEKEPGGVGKVSAEGEIVAPEEGRVEGLQQEAERISQRVTEKAQSELDTIGMEIAQSLGAQWTGTPKSAKSIVSKVMRKRREGRYDPYQIKDHARGVIRLKSWKDAASAIETMRSKGVSVEVFIDEPLNVFGYRGVHGAIGLADNLNGEIQLHTKESWEVKKATDKIYRKWRDQEDKDLNEGDRKLWLRDIETSRNLWDFYWESIPDASKAAISSAVSGFEEEASPKVTPTEGIQPVPSQISARSSDTRSNVPSSKRDRIIKKTPYKTILPKATAEVQEKNLQKSGPAEAGVLPYVSDVQVKKQRGGFYKMFYKGRKAEVFEGTRFTSVKQARNYLRARHAERGSRAEKEVTAEEKEELAWRRKRPKVAREIAERIKGHSLYADVLQEIEKDLRHFGRGPFYVGEQFRSEVEDIVGPVGRGVGSTAAARMFTFEEGEGTPWDTALMQYLAEGRGDYAVLHEEAMQWDISRFAEAVKDAAEAGEDKFGINARALEEFGTIGEPYAAYLAEKYRMIQAGESPEQIDAMTTDWAENYGIETEELADEWVGEAPKRLHEIEQMTDPAKQEAALEALAEANIAARERHEAAMAAKEVLQANDLDDVEVEQVAEITEPLPQEKIRLTPAEEKALEIGLERIRENATDIHVYIRPKNRRGRVAFKYRSYGYNEWQGMEINSEGEVGDVEWNVDTGIPSPFKFVRKIPNPQKGIIDEAAIVLEKHPGRFVNADKSEQMDYWRQVKAVAESYGEDQVAKSADALARVAQTGKLRKLITGVAEAADIAREGDRAMYDAARLVDEAYDRCRVWLWKKFRIEEEYKGERALEEAEPEYVSWEDDIPFSRQAGVPIGAAITAGERQIIQLAYGATAGTGFHEGLHIVWMRKLSEQDKRILLKKFKEEEVVADKYADYRLGRFKPKGIIRAIFQKISRILDKVRNALEGLGYRDWMDIFGEIAEGYGTEAGVPAAEEVRYSMGGMAEKEAARDIGSYSIPEGAAGSKRMAMPKSIERKLTTASTPEQIKQIISDNEAKIANAAFEGEDYLSCDAACEIFSQTLRNKGIPHQIVFGLLNEGTPKEQSHSWIVVDGKHYDATGQGVNEEHYEVELAFDEQGRLNRTEPGFAGGGPRSNENLPASFKRTAPEGGGQVRYSRNLRDEAVARGFAEAKKARVQAEKARLKSKMKKTAKRGVSRAKTVPFLRRKPDEMTGYFDARMRRVMEAAAMMPMKRRILEIAKVKGLTAKQFGQLVKEHTGFRKFTGPYVTQRVGVDKLQKLLEAVGAARPKQIGHKKVINPKTEGQIVQLRAALTAAGLMNDEKFAEILEIETHGRAARYIDATSFVTQKQGRAVIDRMHDEAEKMRVTESYRRARAAKGQIWKAYKEVQKQRVGAKDPSRLASMRYYMQRLGEKAEAPIYELYNALTAESQRLAMQRRRTLERLEELQDFNKIAMDNDALQRVSDYIASQSHLENRPKRPKDITPAEIVLAEEIQAILKQYEVQARVGKFFEHKDHLDEIPQYLKFKERIDRALDIYDSKGVDALINYLKREGWGIVKSGYEPMEAVIRRVSTHRLPEIAVGKSHIKVRGLEYTKQERNILQRLESYMRQMDTLSYLQPKIKALVRVVDDNIEKFEEPDKVTSSVSTYLDNLKHTNFEDGFIEEVVRKIYSQAITARVLADPVKVVRNLMQNAAFSEDRRDLIDPRNSELSEEDAAYLQTYVQQDKVMLSDWAFTGEEAYNLPVVGQFRFGINKLTKWVQRRSLYPLSDRINRTWSFWAKINRVHRAFEGPGTLAEKMRKARFSDMQRSEQLMALDILARDGVGDMARYIAKVHTDNTHFLYAREQRSPAEQTKVGRILLNLFLFRRAALEKAFLQTGKLVRQPGQRLRAGRVLIGLAVWSTLMNLLWRKMTGRPDSPYSYIDFLEQNSGGLELAAMEKVEDVYNDMLGAVTGDEKALAALPAAMTTGADYLIPFYDMGLQAIEATTDTRNIDTKKLRQLRAMIDNEYKVRGSDYEMERSLVEKFQYAFAGEGVDRAKRNK